MQDKIKVLMVCHGKKLLFQKNAGKSRALGDWERIFIPDLYQKDVDLGLWRGGRKCKVKSAISKCYLEIAEKI